MKYYDCTIPERDRSAVCHLLHEVNERLDTMHRLAEKNLEKEFKSEYESLQSYIDGYTSCMIYTFCYCSWFHRRLLDKVNDRYLTDVHAMGQRKAADLCWARKW